MTPKAWLAIGATLVLGLALTAQATRMTWTTESDEHEVAFTRLSWDHLAAVEQALRTHMEVVHGLKEFAAHDEGMAPADFKDFADHVIPGHPGLAAVAWSPRVGVDSFAFLPEVDDASEPVRRATIARALATDTEMVVSPAVTAAGGRSVLVMAPVHDRRGKSLRGLVIAVIRLDQTARVSMQALRDLPGGHPMRLRIFDVSQPGERVPLYIGARPEDQGKPAPESLSPLRTERPVQVADRNWMLVSVPSQAFVEAYTHWTHRGVAAGGVAVTLLLAGLVAMTGRTIEARRRSRAELEELVVRRTGELAGAEARARALARQNDLLLQSVGEGIYGVDTEGIMTFANTAALRMVGFDRDELIGRNQHAMLHHTHADGTVYPAEDCPILASFRDGQAHRQLGDVFWRKDGSSFPVEFVSAPVKDGEQVVGAVVVFRDVTEQRQAAERLRQSEERYRALSEAMTDAIIAVDGEGSIVSWNPGATRLFGWDEDEIRGQPLTIIIPTRHRAAHLDGFTRAKADGLQAVGRVMALDGQHRDGTVFPIELSLGRWDVGGQAYFGAVIRDIRARKAAEEAQRAAEAERHATATRLNLVMDTVKEGVFGIDDEGRVIFANAAAAEMLGWPSPKDMQGRDSFDISGHHLADGRPCSEGGCLIRTTLADGEVRRVADESFTDRQGRTMPVEYVVSPLVVSGVVVGAVVAFHDISERRALEADLKRSNGELEQFAYVASHDLRQPLRMISSYLKMIETRLGADLTEEMRTFIGFAVSGAKRMDRLILDLLEYSRIGRGRSAFEPVALGEVVADALQNLVVEVRDAGAEVAVDCELPVVAGRAMELTRLFQNLVGNAIKYRAPDRSPRIRIECRVEGADCLVRVVDNGMGIQPDDRDRAFQVFQRLVPRDHCEGTGIGLAVCKKIVELHGGRIWIEPAADGGGTVFAFTLHLSHGARQ
ncbi:MAG: PAS domain S-box protein [Actinomycetota bacterium]